MSALVSSVRRVGQRVAAAYAGDRAGEEASCIVAEIDQPLRVAVAGRVKAGKSTLLNALIGDELASTDAGECTRIVTWYEDSVTYRVTVNPVVGAPWPARFWRDQGALRVDLDGTCAEDVSSLVVEWPATALHGVSYADTPGIGSLSTAFSDRTLELLTPGDARRTSADAVLYLMRHVHRDDMGFLEDFQDRSLGQPSPINAIAVLSRADEIGAGRLDAMSSARRIAARYRDDPKLRHVCQTVAPVAGLLAQAGATLREPEFRAFTVLAGHSRDELDALLLSVDRFTARQVPVQISAAERVELLDRFGLFGVRLAVDLVATGRAPTASVLASELVETSGISDLRRLLAGQFAGRAALLKARTALLGLDSLLRSASLPGAEDFLAETERIEAGAHEFAEVRLLNALRAGLTSLDGDDRLEAERLLGGAGDEVHQRAGLPVDAGGDDVRDELSAAHARWRRRLESPLSSRDAVEIAEILVRSCEGMLNTTAVSRTPNLLTGGTR